MSTTNGSFSLSALPDLTKSSAGFAVALGAGASVVSVVDPKEPQQAFTVFNTTSNWLRGRITFVAGITGVDQQAFIVPPGGTYTWDSADHDGDNAVGSLDAIELIEFDVLDMATVTAGNVVDAPSIGPAANVIPGVFAINFASA